MTEILVSAFITLLVVVDPVGLGPIFIGLTQGIGAAERRKIAWEACIIAFCVLTGSTLIGDWLLAQLGISLAAFRIAGGLLLFAIAFEMVFGNRVERETGRSESRGSQHIAAFPLAIPLMAGPGAITAMVLLAERMNGNWLGFLFLIGSVAAVLAITLFVFLASEHLDRLLGHQAQVVMGRLLGVLLASLAVQYVADGILSLAKD